MLDMAREALEKQLRSLVAAGLVSNEVEAWRACMHRLRLLTYHTLQWYLERKAAVIAVGGTQDDILGVLCANPSMQRVLHSLLLWQRARCACNSSAPALKPAHQQPSYCLHNAQ